MTFIKYFNHESLIYVLRTPRESSHECIFSLMSVTEIKKINVVFRTLKVTSCQRTCLNNLIEVMMAHERAGQGERRRGGSSLEGSIEGDDELKERIRASLETVEL
jgi:hypothetical protein